MNVPDSWVKEVCEKLGIPEPSNPIGIFWDGDAIGNWWVHSIDRLDDSNADEVYPYHAEANDEVYEHFKPLSAETISMIKKDLGIE